MCLDVLKGEGEGGFREGGAIQASVFFRIQEWRLPVADRCAGFQLFSAVKSGGYPLQMDVQGFNCFPSWVVCLHMLDCHCLPFHLVLLVPCMHCNAALHIVSLHCSFVFTYPLLQCSSCFSNVDTLAFGTWYLVHDSFLLPHWLGVFCLHQGFPLNLKYTDFRYSSMRWHRSGAGMVILSMSVSSCRRSLLMTC